MSRHDFVRHSMKVKYSLWTLFLFRRYDGHEFAIPCPCPYPYMAVHSLTCTASIPMKQVAQPYLHSLILLKQLYSLVCTAFTQNWVRVQPWMHSLAHYR